MSSYRNNDFVVACIIGLMGSMCFISSLDGNFVYDDEEAVVNNRDLRPNSSLISLFKHDFWGTNITHNSSHKSYRPLTVLSFRLNVWLNNGELNPLHFHLFNVILHFVATAMSYPLFGKLFNIQRLWGSKAFFSSLLFAVHPVHTETVAGIVGRADLLCAILSFTSFFVYCKATKTTSFVSTFWLTWLSVFLAGLGMFCKEQGITIIGICSAFDILVESKDHPFHIFTLKKGIIREILIHILLKKVSSKKAFSWWNILLKQFRFALRHLILFIGGCLLIYLRCWIMNFTTPEFRKIDNPHSFIDDTFTRVLNYNYIYALNAWLLICPEWLCFDWSMGCVPPLSVEEDQTDRRLIIPVIFWVVLSCLFLKCLLSAPDPFIRELSMALSFIIITFSIATNLPFRVGFVIAERVLYMPSIGFCMLIVIGMNQLTSYFKNNFLHIFFVFLLFVNIIRCHQRSAQWRTEKDLFLSGLKVCPLNAKIHYNYAKVIKNSTVAVKHYREAIRLYPEYEQAMNNLANILRDNGNISESEALLKKAISIRPDFATAWMNLGIVLAAKNKYEKALESYNKALTYRKNYPDCYYNLGNLFLSKKMYNEAYAAWMHATNLKPTHSIAWNNIIVMLDSIGDLDEAEILAKKALRVLPSDPGLHFNLANTLGKKGTYEEAEKHFLTAIQLKPKQALYHTNLGVLYHRWKKYKLAKAEYLKALNINPNLKNINQNLEVVESILQKVRNF